MSFIPHPDTRKGVLEYPETVGTMRSSSGVSSRYNSDYNASTMSKPRPAAPDPAYGDSGVQPCGCKPRTDQDNAYICSAHWNMNQEAHEYLDVDVVSRVRSLQAQLETLKATMQSSDTSVKSKNTIYERIDRRPKDEQDTGMGAFLSNVARMRGLYRLSNICNTDLHCCSRLVWMIVMAVCLCMAGYQVSDRVLYYNSSPQYINIESRPSDHLSFPAVTVCNLNKFRLSKVVELDLYDVIYAHLHNSTANADQLYRYRQQLSSPYQLFLSKSSHTKEDMIYKCVWKTAGCTNRNFTVTYTNQQVCVTFNASTSEAIVDTAGSHTGLYIVVNTEQYEYILGPTSAVGVRLSLHDPALPPSHFFNVPVGKLTSVQVKKVTYDRTSRGIYDTSPSHDHLSSVQCKHACIEKSVVRACACYLPNFTYKPESIEPCSTYMYFKCVHTLLDQSTSTCGCGNKPAPSGYDVTLSYASLPRYALESEVRTLKRRSELEKHFRKSMDFYHRYDKVVFRHDTEILSAIKLYLERCQDTTDTILDSAKIYEVEYKRIIEDIKAVFNKKSHTVRLHKMYYKERYHVTFTSYIGLIKGFLDEIVLFEESVKAAVNLKSINTTLNTIMWKIQQIVTTGNGGSQSPPMLQEIKNGVEIFRDKSVLEYGIKYKSFRANRDWYIQTTEVVLEYVDELDKALKAQYQLMKEITTTNDRDWVSKADALSRFFMEIKNIISGKLHELQMDSNTLLNKYREDTAKIIEVLNKFDKIALEFDAKIESFMSYLNTINSSLPDILMKITRMKERTTKISTNYTDNNLGKLQLATRLTSPVFMNEQQDITESLVELSRVVIAMNENSGQLSESLDSSLFTALDMTVRTDSVQSTQLVKQIKGLVNLISETMMSLERYQNELKEYNAATRVNENFYINNFLHIDVHFKQMTETFHTEHWSYTIFDLSCDIGCTLALYLGASILSLFQLVDFLTSCSVYVKNKQRRG